VAVASEIFRDPGFDGEAGCPVAGCLAGAGWRGEGKNAIQKKKKRLKSYSEYNKILI
jgi:hypothetical protein